MRDEQGFRTFAAEQGAELRRQAYLLTGSAAGAAEHASDALAATSRHWDALPPDRRVEHVRS